MSSKIKLLQFKISQGSERGAIRPLKPESKIINIIAVFTEFLKAVRDSPRKFRKVRNL